MKIPLPWRRKSNPAVHQLSSSPPSLSLISLPTTTSSSSSSSSPQTSPRPPTSPRSPAFLTTPTTLHTRQHAPLARSPSPRQHHPPPQLYRSNEDTDSRSASLYLSATTDTTECTTTYTDLYASTATYTVVGEEEELNDDEFIANGLLPCSPRWLADHADDSVRQHRANAQMGALAALRAGRFLTAVDS